PTRRSSDLTSASNRCPPKSTLQLSSTRNGRYSSTPIPRTCSSGAPYPPGCTASYSSTAAAKHDTSSVPPAATEAVRVSAAAAVSREDEGASRGGYAEGSSRGCAQSTGAPARQS